MLHESMLVFPGLDRAEGPELFVSGWVSLESIVSSLRVCGIQCIYSLLLLDTRFMLIVTGPDNILGECSAYGRSIGNIASHACIWSACMLRPSLRQVVGSSNVCFQVLIMHDDVNMKYACGC